MKYFVLLPLLSIAAVASPCVILSIPPDASVVTITCPGFGPGISQTYRPFAANEWARFVGLDTAKADTSSTK